jgi:hypothetical protein
MLFDFVKVEPGITIDDVAVGLRRSCTDTGELGYALLWQGAPDHR